MPKRRIPIVGKALNLLKLSILMAKMRGPITPRLVFLKKTKKIKLLRHYNYGFIEEYEFSPSRAPLFQHNKRRRRQFKKRNIAWSICSMMFPCRCLRVEGGEFDGEVDGNYTLEALPSIGNGVVEEILSDLGDEEEEEEEDYSSVDERAEMFIQRFYENMRVQRQESVLQCREMT